MSDSPLISKPLVFSGLMVCIGAFLTLLYPSKFNIIFAIFLAAALVVISVLIYKSKFIFIPFVLLTIIFGCIIPFSAHLKHEIPSQKFAEKFSGETHIYTANVDSSSYSSSSSYSTFFVTLTHIDEKELSHTPKARITCFSGDFAKRGDKIQFSGICDDISNLDTSEFDTQNYLRSKKVFINFATAEILSSQKSGHGTFLSRLSNLIESSLFKNIPENYNYDSVYVAKALLLGDKSSLTKPLKDSFRAAGLSHILCVSGMHLSIILGFISVILKKLTLHKKLLGICVIGFCVFYMFFTGLSPSVIRAGIMACVTYTAFIFGRKGDSFISLFLAATFMILLNPYVVLDISAQLSFIATFGVIMMSSLFDNTPVKETFFGKFLHILLCAVLINLGAVCFTLPISAFSFGSVSLISFVSTLCVSLLCEISLILLLILAFVSFLPGVHFLPEILGNVCNFIINIIIKISDSFAYLKYSYIPCEAQNSVIIPYLISLALCVLLISFGKRILVRVLLCIIVLYSICLGTVFLLNFINQDSVFKVSYFGKSKDDFEISIKLEDDGYLLVNPDSILCTDANNLAFDTHKKQNYLLILPDQNDTNFEILAHNVHLFKARFGLSGIFVPDTLVCKELKEQFEKYGLEVLPFNKFENPGSLCITLTDTGDNYALEIKDKNKECFIVLGQNFDINDFDGHKDICAYYPMPCGKDYNMVSDDVPNALQFFTRLKKGQEHEKISNTYGKSSFYIKE